ncbi:MAG: hypothetical protein WCI74_11815, partial [Actinomycetes bacterium]
TLQGWMNGWIPQTAELSGTMTYSPAMTARKALYLFPVAVLAGIVWLLLPWPRRWRRRRAERWRNRHHEKVRRRMARRAARRAQLGRRRRSDTGVQEVTG